VASIAFQCYFRTAKMPREWRFSTVILLYKNKGGIQDCNNYRAIKLLSHTMKLWEMVIKKRLRKDISITENQFGLCRAGRPQRRFTSFKGSLDCTERER